MFTNFFQSLMVYMASLFRPAIVAETQHQPTLQALVIGIDTYKSDAIENLRGAVSDADAVDEYLRSDLSVPKKQIVNLRNEQATREAIISNIKALRTREGIHRGDPILIYFAGHGCTAKAPKGWHMGDRGISLLVPYDMDTKLENAAESKCAIPDRTLGALLHGLAEQEGDGGIGDNITVIFDCCHSGSGTRGLSDTRRPRGFTSKSMLPDDLDRHIWSMVPRGRDIEVLTGFARAGTKSHVLLAACRETESAYEGHDRGYFTQELIRVLRTVRPDRITYQELIQRIPTIPGQTPQCEGFNTNRIVFNALVPSGKRVAYPVVVIERPEKVVVRAGSVNGVAEDTTFSLYSSGDFKLDDPPIAIMKALKVGPFTTDLAYLAHRDSTPGAHPSLKNSCFAVMNSLDKAGGLRLHATGSTHDPIQRPVWQALEKVDKTHQLSGGPTVVVEVDKTKADLGVCVVGGDATYTIQDPLITDLGLNKLCQTTKADINAIQSVLSAAAHFFWHLHHAPRKNELKDRVDVGFHELAVDEEAELDENLSQPWITLEPNLRDGAGVVEVVADDETPYGIVVRNKTLAPLHVWAFYFSCSTLGIFEYYKPPASGCNAEASLPAKGELTIGYGADGGQPYKFFLRDDQALDVGFIKLFITTEPVDFSNVAQCSPFAMARNLNTNKRPAPRAIWDTATIAVVQKRSP
ncbi:unnamed protein product [Peniophora sp. CBMAI 1063]|nr:unnamed protein product [Peniophora sp. CBMAI 1063]